MAILRDRLNDMTHSVLLVSPRLPVQGMKFTPIRHRHESKPRLRSVAHRSCSLTLAVPAIGGPLRQQGALSWAAGLVF